MRRAQELIPTMNQVSPLPSVSVSSSSLKLFSANGTSIVWDKSKAQFMTAKMPRPASLGDFIRCGGYRGYNDFRRRGIHSDWDAERGPLGAVRFLLLDFLCLIHPPFSPWQRRERSPLMPDRFMGGRPLRSYAVRSFSVHRESQIGATLHVSAIGVEAVIRAGPSRVIVKVIGQVCSAEMWLAPSDNAPHWSLIHRELTWASHLLLDTIPLTSVIKKDPIAQRTGFKDVQEELLDV